MTTWISHEQAATILGVARSTVGRMIERGELDSRGYNGRGAGCLRAGQVHALADRRAGEAATRDVRRRERAARRAARAAIGPPDDGRDWLTIAQAAQVLGITRQAMHHRVRSELSPSTIHGGRHWVRRDLLELQAHARAAHKDHDQPLLQRRLSQ